MKISTVSILALLAFAPLAVVIVQADSNSTTYPGRCTSTKDCATYGPGLDCIAVDSNTAGLATLNMCIASGTICSGSIAGRCPTFSSWPTAYRKVQTVCAFTVVANCNKKIDAPAPKPSSGSSDSGEDPTDAGVSLAPNTTSVPSADNTTVECYVRNFTVNDESKVVNGIYQCQDARKYMAANGGHLTNLTQSQLLACGGNVSSPAPTLCSGQGTCSPTTSFAQEYECKCNRGYTGDKFCAKVTSNECSNLGQCGVSGTCVLQNATSGACSCKNGAVGNQCAACDPTSKASDVCSGRGACSSDGVCACKAGYTGSQCADAASGGGGSGGATANDAIKTLAATLALAVALGAMVFA